MAWGTVGGESAKVGMIQNAKNVMIQDERKGSTGRGVMAGGGESQSERNMDNRREGKGERVGGQSSLSQPAMPTCASCS